MTVQVEISQIELRYAGLRIMDAGRDSRLAASLAREGQQTPVLVVAEAEDRYVLIDGYRRVAMLSRLGNDLVEAVVLPVTEAEALVLSFRLETAARRSALQDGWLLRELVERHGMTQHEVAVRLGRSKSWVSGRLALVRALPDAAQEAVKGGVVPAHAAAKYLVPFARANWEHCKRLVEALGGQGVSDRQVEQLWVGWRAGDAEQRERIVAHPHLYLKVEDVAVRPAEVQADAMDGLLGDLEGVAGLCRRARRRLREGVFARANACSRDRVAQAWLETRTGFNALVGLMEAEVPDVGLRDTNGDSAASS